MEMFLTHCIRILTSGGIWEEKVLDFEDWNKLEGNPNDDDSVGIRFEYNK